MQRGVGRPLTAMAPGLVAISLAGGGSDGLLDRVNPLRILVIDEHAQMALPVIDTLAQRGHRCDMQPAAVPALAALAAKSYQVVVANAALPDLDPIAFLRTLRERHARTPVILYAVMAQLDRAVFEAAAALDARFLDLPIDRARLILLVESFGGPDSSATGPRANTTDQPFFGTSRITRATPSTERYQQPPTIGTAPPVAPSVTQPAPQAPRTQRTPLPPTGNVVRQGTDRFANTGNNPTTQRIRRGITGRIERPSLVGEQSAPAAPGMRVACATCRREFMVEARLQSYNIVCVHCGQLNRIEPRPS